MNIWNLLSTPQRIKILKKIIYSDHPITVSKTARELKLSKGLVSKFFNILVSEKILKKQKKKFIILDNLFVKSIKILLNINIFNPALFKKYPFIEGVGLYGSCVKGTNIEDSDIDLWVKIKKVKEEELSKLTNELKRKDERIKPLFLTKEKIEVFKKEDIVFYYSLVFGSITLYGEEIEV